MRLRTERGYTRRVDLETVVKVVRRRVYGVLEGEPGHFVQWIRTASGDFLLEKRSGHPDTHRRVAGLSGNDIMALLEDYLAGDPDWGTGLRWRRIPIHEDADGSFYPDTIPLDPAHN